MPSSLLCSNVEFVSLDKRQCQFVCVLRNKRVLLDQISEYDLHRFQIGVVGCEVSNSVYFPYSMIRLNRARCMCNPVF